MQELIESALLELSNNYLNIVPNGHIKTSYSEFFKSGTLRIGLVSNVYDCSSNIRENDKGYGIFHISYKDGIFTLTKNYHALTVEPKIKYHALGHDKVSFRKIKAKNIDELVAKFNKYLNRFLDMVEKNASDNTIYKQDTFKKEYLVFNR